MIDVPSGWERVKIGEIAEVVGGGTPSTKVKRYFDGGIPWITPKDLASHPKRYTECGERTLTGEGLANSSAKLLPPGSVLISSRAPIGLVTIAKSEVATNQGFRSLILRPGFLSEFIYYRMIHSRQDLISAANGTTFMEVSGSSLKEVEILVPPIDEQRAIAGVLGALDDKIESNRRIARIAHDLASETLDAAADSRVPLESVGTIVMGTSPPGSTYNEDGVGVPFYQGVADFEERFPGIRVFCSEPVRMAEAEDVLISVRAPVGRINVARQQCCIGRGLAAVRSAFPSIVYYALIRSHEAWEPFNAEGTVFGAIKAADLGATRIRWPSRENSVALERELSEIDRTIGLAFDEIQTLTSLRDALLPELLSGRLRVRDTGSLLEDEL